MFVTKPCKNLDGFLQKARALQAQKNADWIFRGQKEDEPLKTLLERDCERYGVPGPKIGEVEERMIREFQRRLHHYTDNVPDKDSKDEWMALMRHHGAPTRLLDFTYSPYVAAYFALEYADANTFVTVWAVNAGWCEEQLHRRYVTLFRRYKLYQENRGSSYFKSIFMPKKPRKLVLAVNPFRLNERLAYQRGVFLCPGDVTVGFMDNLRDFAGKQNSDDKLIRFTIQTGRKGVVRDNALRRLDQMNISRIVLFPGLDGFAQSFSPRTRIHFLEGIKWPSSGSEG